MRVSPIGALLLSLAFASGVVPKKKLTIVNIEPMNGGWAGGVAMAEAIRYTLPLLNANPLILPDYEVEVLMTNDGCNPDEASAQILDLFFNGNIPKMDFATINGEVDIFNWDNVDTFVGNMGQSAYVGVLGSGCSGATMAICKIVAKARKPLVTQSATSPALSDRSKYPFFWRSPQPDTNSLRAMSQISQTMADSVALWSSPNSDGWTLAILETLLSSTLNVVGGMAFPDESGLCTAYCADKASRPCQNCRGYYIYDYDFAGDGYQEVKNLVGSFKRQPTRIHFHSVYGTAQAVILCALKTAQVVGVVPVGLAWAYPTTSMMPDLDIPCDHGDITDMLRGAIGCNGVNQRVDRGNDHGCIPGMDPVDLNDQIMARVDKKDSNGHYPPDRDYVGPASDSMCIYSRALDKMLYDVGVSYDDMFDMDEWTYMKIQDQFGLTNFQGITGPVKYVYQNDPVKTEGFPNGLPGPDPQGLTNVWQLEDTTGVVVLPPTGVVGDSVNWKVTELKFQGFNGEIEKTAPGQLIAVYVDCPLGMALEFYSNTCQTCPAGTFPEQGSCQECREGEFAKAASAECSACPKGFYGELMGQEDCIPCTSGTIAALNGQTKCETCVQGFYSNADNSECVQCARGSYSADGASECTLCDPTAETGFTTLTTGATKMELCTCEPGTFWNVRDDKCEGCRDEAFCPGGLHLPAVFEGKYGKLMGDVSQHDDAMAAKQAGTFSKATYGGGFYDIIVYNCHQQQASSLCPQDSDYTVEESTPWDLSFYGVGKKVVDGETTKVRPGSPENNLGASCSNLRIGIACGKCEDGFYGEVECTECHGGANILNVVLILMMPFIMIILYRLTSARDTRRVQAAFVMVSTWGMGVFVIQTIAVFDSFPVTWPLELSFVFDLGQIFLFDMGGLSLSCMSGQSFTAKYWGSLLFPVILLCMTAVGFGLTKVLPVPHDWVMQADQTFNMLGMLLTALYVTLVKIVVAYWECSENPSPDHETLARYRDIECASDDRLDATPPMVLGLLVYVVGIYVKFLHVAYAAPNEWPKPEFREKWRFMLTRWRPDVWFWGSMVMTRNLMVACAGIVANEPRVQLIYLVWVVSSVFTVTAIWQPWRVPMLNISDILSCCILNAIGVFGLVFVSLHDEIELNTRLGRSHIADRQASLQKTLAVVLAVLFALFVVVFLGVICWALMLLVPGRAAQEEQQMESSLKELYNQTVVAVKDDNFENDVKRLIDNSNAYDRNGLMTIINKLKLPGGQIGALTGHFKKMGQDKAAAGPSSVSA